MAAGRALEASYSRLQRYAAGQLSRWFGGATWEPTALVNQAFDRLVSRDSARRWGSSRHFRGLMQRAIREILIERYRRETKPPPRREDLFESPVPLRGSVRKKTFGSAQAARLRDCPDYAQTLALHEAMDRLRKLHPLCGQVIDLRYLAGLTIDETARRLEVSTATIERKSAFARAWLRRQLLESSGQESSGPIGEGSR